MGRYIVTAPIFPNGWTLLGEVGKFIPMSRDRFQGLVVVGNGLQVDVHGSKSENVIIDLIAPGVLAATSRAANKSLAMITVRCSLGQNGRAVLRCGASLCEC